MLFHGNQTTGEIIASLDNLSFPAKIRTCVPRSVEESLLFLGVVRGLCMALSERKKEQLCINPPVL